MNCIAKVTPHVAKIIIVELQLGLCSAMPTAEFDGVHIVGLTGQWCTKIAVDCLWIEV